MEKHMNFIVNQKPQPPQKEDVLQFGGLNYTNMITDGELTDALNLSNRDYPWLSTRLGRELAGNYDKPTALWTIRDKLVVVDGTKLYLDSDMVYEGLREGEKQFANLGNRLIIFPDKILYNTDTGETEPLEVSVTLANVTFGKSDDEYISISTTDETVNFTELFSIWDTIEIEGAADNEQNNTYFTILEMTANPETGYVEPAITAQEIKINTDLGFGTESESGTVTISRKVPDLDLICSHQNRLFGVKDYTIYASKLGDPKNFNQFLGGTEADSWTGDVTSDGEFTGLVSYMGALMAFKQESIIRVSGSDGVTYTVSDEYKADGVRSGCAKSIVNIGGMLYYYSRNGIMLYYGDIPQNISQKLNYPDLYNAVGGSDGRCYYLNAEDAYGANTLYVYEPRLGSFLLHDRTDAIGFVFCRERLYYLSGNSLYALERGSVDPPDADGESRIPWHAVFTPFDVFKLDRNVYTGLTLDVEIEPGGWCELQAAYNRPGNWIPITRLLGEEMRRTYTIPIKPSRQTQMYIRIAGLGQATIHGLRRKYVESTARSKGR
jgi:hypothetical protein